MERVYPRLRLYCQERGYQFQVVDMRWGISDESTNDHMATELCLQEITNCQQLSTGPNFVVSVAHTQTHTHPHKLNGQQVSNKYLHMH